MANLLPGESSSSHGFSSTTNHGKNHQEKSGWYFSRKEIEENSPSRQDGIDLKKETYLRKSYCTFLQDLGMRLKVPQITIATAIIFCHRFFLRQSHAKNDRRTIATVCMFLAGKVEETPRPLKDVILVAYEIIHKKDPDAVQRIKEKKEVYEQQKELILLGERVVLATLGFDLNVYHPYKPLVDAIKKFKVAQNALAQVAWNFVNDGLRTSLCLQFKPHHIAAGAIFLAAKFLKVKLPSDGEKVWWQEFDVTPRQLEEVSNQMLELYEQNRVPPSTNSEAEGSTAGGATNRVVSKASSGNEEHATINSHSQAGGPRPGTSKSMSRPANEQPRADSHGGPRSTQNQGNDHCSSEVRSASDHNADEESNFYHETETLTFQENGGDTQSTLRHTSDGIEDRRRNAVGDYKEAGELKDKHVSRDLEPRDSAVAQSPQDVVKKIDIDKDKMRAIIEKRRKTRGGEITRKTDLLDEDDLIERELEDGIELGTESEKNKRDRRQSGYKPTERQEYESLYHGKRQEDAVDGQHQGIKGQPSQKPDLNNMEEGEVPDESDRVHPSPKLSNRRRKTWSSPDRAPEGKQRSDYAPGSYHYDHHDYTDDRNRNGRLGYIERDHKRHAQENHV